MLVSGSSTWPSIRRILQELCLYKNIPTQLHEVAILFCTPCTANSDGYLYMSIVCDSNNFFNCEHIQTNNFLPITQNNNNTVMKLSETCWTIVIHFYKNLDNCLYVIGVINMDYLWGFLIMWITSVCINKDVSFTYVLIELN